MAVKLYQAGYDQARELVEAGKVVLDERRNWGKHQPSAAAHLHGMLEALREAKV